MGEDEKKIKARGVMLNPSDRVIHDKKKFGNQRFKIQCNVESDSVIFN